MSFETLARKFDKYSECALTEKLYAHIDRSCYLTGETMWFKVYYVDGLEHRPLDISKVIYVELVDEAKISRLQAKIYMSSGSIVLPNSLKSGNYSFVAYTSWMTNFKPDFFFKAQVTIINPFVPIEQNSAKDSSAYSLQFFPEGGYMVDGLTSKIAFRAVDNSGRSFNTKGVIINSRNDTVTTFRSEKFGLGNFLLTPKAKEKYRAVTVLPNQSIVFFDLPESVLNGYSLTVKDTTYSRLQVSIKSTIGFKYEDVFLLVHTRGKVVIAKMLTLESGVIDVLLSRDSLAEGISHLTVFNQQLVPVCERLYFKKIENIIDFKIKANKTTTLRRDKIELSIESDSVGQFEEVDLSVSVHKIDSVSNIFEQDITSYLKLTSDLTGSIESPMYYLSDSASQSQIDNLMLTHGWRRFDWDKIKEGAAPEITNLPEVKYHGIHGVVKHKETGMPVGGTKVYFSIPGKKKFEMTTTNQNGEFRFEVDYFGIEKLIFQTRESHCIYISSPFNTNHNVSFVSKLVLTEKHRNEIEQRSIYVQVQNAMGQGGRIINAEKTAYSQFFGNADKEYKLDDYTRFTSMEEVLREYVPEVSIRKSRGNYNVFVVNPSTNYFFTEEPLVLLDGTPIFDTKKLFEVNPLLVDELKIVNKNYYFLGLNFGGILNYSTYKGDLANYVLDSLTKQIEYNNFSIKREFMTPAYDNVRQKLSREPDVRNTLYWNPNLNIEEGKPVKIQFYTSDIIGKYVVKVKGLSKKGRTGSSYHIIDVISGSD